MRSYLGTLLITLFLFWNTPAQGNGVDTSVVCSKAQEYEALEIASRIRDWTALYTAYTRFAACDDGGIAEGFTESVVKILAENWTSLRKLEQIYRKDPSFLRFIRRHINATADLQDLERIRINVKKYGCSVTSRKVCNEIKRGVTQALEEAQ